MLKTKKADAKQAGKAFLALFILVIIFMIVWPRLNTSSKNFFSILGLGEKCQYTGKTYNTQLQELKAHVVKERYDEAKLAYEILKKCFPQKEEEIKKELISYFKSLTDTKIVNPQGYLDFIKFLTTSAGIDKSQIETPKYKQKIQTSELEVIQAQYNKVMGYISVALNPSAELSKTQNIGVNKRRAIEEQEKLKSVCKEAQSQPYSEIVARIKSDCETKNKEINDSLVKVDCLYWKEYANDKYTTERQAWQASALDRQYSPTYVTPQDYLVTSYVYYTHAIEKATGKSQCSEIKSAASTSRVELIQEISKIRNGNVNLFYNRVCNYVTTAPEKGVSDGSIGVERLKAVCKQLDTYQITCNDCKLVLTPTTT